jgi:hypothetical protein
VTAKSISGKASPKDGSVSDYITAPVCKSELASPFATAEICPAEVLTQVSPEKLVISEGVQVAEPVEQVVTQPIEEPVRTPEDPFHSSIMICVRVPIPGPVPGLT